MYTETFLLLLPVEILYIISSYCNIDERLGFSKVLSKFVDIPYHRKVFIPESLAAAIEKRPLPISDDWIDSPPISIVYIEVTFKFPNERRSMILQKLLHFTIDLTKLFTTNKMIPVKYELQDQFFFSYRVSRGFDENYSIKSEDGKFYYNSATENPEWKPFDHPIQT